ncbi:hypothetical protein L345_08068, partial [Ophiophagus hannah]
MEVLIVSGQTSKIMTDFIQSICLQNSSPSAEKMAAAQNISPIRAGFSLLSSFHWIVFTLSFKQLNLSTLCSPTEAECEKQRSLLLKGQAHLQSTCDLKDPCAVKHVELYLTVGVFNPSMHSRTQNVHNILYSQIKTKSQKLKSIVYHYYTQKFFISQLPKPQVETGEREARDDFPFISYAVKENLGPFISYAVKENLASAAGIDIGIYN